MACPFLIVKEDGSYDYNYYCKSCDRKIGSTDDKRFVENVCRSGSTSYENCDAYKHPGHSPRI